MIPRTQRLASELKHQIGRIVHDELKDPRIGFVTVTHVEITPDLQFAKVFFSVLGDKREKDAAKKGLESAGGFIKRLIGQRVKMRYSPELKFVLDESYEYAQHIDEILKKEKDKKDSK